MEELCSRPVSEGLPASLWAKCSRAFSGCSIISGLLWYWVRFNYMEFYHVLLFWRRRLVARVLREAQSCSKKEQQEIFDWLWGLKRAYCLFSAHTEYELVMLLQAAVAHKHISILLREKSELHPNLLCKASVLRPHALWALTNSVPEKGLLFCWSILLLR